MRKPSGDSDSQARARALSSPLRLRILRICLHEARTNKEIADVLGITPAACLHHVRTLADNGFLAAEEPRQGRRGAWEIPYRATGASWGSPLPSSGQHLLLETFLQEIEGLAPEELDTTRLGLKLDEAHLEELRSRLKALLEEFIERGPDPDGTPISLFIAEHPDPQADSP